MKTNRDSSTAITILYVEDHKETREALGATLIRCFPAVRFLVAENGSTGLELFQRNHPDIVMTDIDMPVLDGIAMCSVIKDLAPDTAIIVLSACSEARRLMQAIVEPSMSDFVPKPIDFDSLFHVITSSLNRIALARGAGGVSHHVKPCS
jgi:YesN/AraC family two-component response regulator